MWASLGQGLNAALEDCQILARVLDSETDGDSMAQAVDIPKVLEAYNDQRLEDAQAACTERNRNGRSEVNKTSIRSADAPGGDSQQDAWSFGSEGIPTARSHVPQCKGCAVRGDFARSEEAGRSKQRTYLWRPRVCRDWCGC